MRRNTVKKTKKSESESIKNKKDTTNDNHIVDQTNEHDTLDLVKNSDIDASNVAKSTDPSIDGDQVKEKESVDQATVQDPAFDKETSDLKKDKSAVVPEDPMDISPGNILLFWLNTDV